MEETYGIIVLVSMCVCPFIVRGHKSCYFFGCC